MNLFRFKVKRSLDHRTLSSHPQQFVDIYRCAASDFIPCDVRIYHDRRRPSRLEVLRLR